MFGLDIQIADVKQALGSLRRMCEAGSRVAFDDEGSYVEHKGSGERSELHRARGCYVLSLRVTARAKRIICSEAGNKGTRALIWSDQREC